MAATTPYLHSVLCIPRPRHPRPEIREQCPRHEDTAYPDECSSPAWAVTLDLMGAENEDEFSTAMERAANLEVPAERQAAARLAPTASPPP